MASTIVTPDQDAIVSEIDIVAPAGVLEEIKTFAQSESGEHK